MSMNDYTPNKRLLKSIVWHGEQCFYVSTIERDYDGWSGETIRLNETIVWEFDWLTQNRGCLIHSDGGGGACVQHCAVVERLFKTGKPEKRESC